MSVRFYCLLALASLTAQANEAAVCDAYRHIESELRCPTNGYLINTGYALCRKYAEIDAEFSLEGRITMAKIRRCLTGTLLARAKDLTCENVAEVGYSSHVGCYVNSGFCDLPLRDKALVFTHAGRTIFSGKAWAEFPALERACGGN